MAYNTALGAPLAKYDSEGRYDLVRLHRNGLAAAAPVVAYNCEGIQDVTLGAMSFGVTREIYHQGGGDNRVEIERQQKSDGSIVLLPGYAPTFIAAVLNKTWASTNNPAEAALPIHFKNYPIGTIECIQRDADNKTHLWSVVYQDIIIKEFEWSIALGNGTVSIPIFSYHDPFVLKGGGSAVGAEIVMDKFTGDGSTVAFTLSGAPIDLVNNTDLAREDWVFDDLVYVATKTATDNEYIRQVSGVTHTSGTVTFGTAPASGTIVEVLYAVAHTA